jgi:2-amino-4-deoxychorismate synthase
MTAVRAGHGPGNRVAEVDDPLAAVLQPDPPPFAMLCRPEATGTDTLTVLLGDTCLPGSLADIPLRPADSTQDRAGSTQDRAGSTQDRAGSAQDRHDALVLIPYRQLAERGFSCVEDDAPLIALTVRSQAEVPVAELRRRLPNREIELTDAGFDVDDASYAATVQEVLAREIGTGVGANFVLKRSFVADIADYTPHAALVLFARLLARESGSYWTFIVHTGDRTLVGATPERHVSMRGGTAVMNPISGTYRYPASGPTLAGIMDFLSDRKEIDELYMVLDEELKMMSRVCAGGGRVIGPYLREMAQLAHTEYLIEGHSELDPREILRETMFAPTVTGSPLESACRVISRYEPEGRGYYSGAIALLGRDQHGAHALDSAILIRSAEINAAGRLRAGVGATLVRHSQPQNEVAETRAKAASLISALNLDAPARFGDHPGVREVLAERNADIADFWRSNQPERYQERPALAGHRVLIIDAEDTFTSMIADQLQALGLIVTIRRYDEPYALSGYDLIVMGPGPGDPTDLTDPKIAHLQKQIRQLLSESVPFLAVCLSHQVLSLELGLRVKRRAMPNQGVQRRIDLFGSMQRVGFYNTYAACSVEDKLDHPEIGPVEISRDEDTDEVHALRGPSFASIQFHAESVLTKSGPDIIAGLLRDLLSAD